MTSNHTVFLPTGNDTVPGGVRLLSCVCVGSTVVFSGPGHGGQQRGTGKPPFVGLFYSLGTPMTTVTGTVSCCLVCLMTTVLSAIYCPTLHLP